MTAMRTPKQRRPEPPHDDGLSPARDTDLPENIRDELVAAGLAGQFVRHFDDAIDGALDGARRALGLPVAPRSPLITSFVVSGMISTFHRCAALPDGEFAAAFGDLLAALAAQGRAEAAGVDLVRGGGGSGNESGGPGEGL